MLLQEQNGLSMWTITFKIKQIKRAISLKCLTAIHSSTKISTVWCLMTTQGSKWRWLNCQYIELFFWAKSTYLSHFQLRLGPELQSLSSIFSVGWKELAEYSKIVSHSLWYNQGQSSKIACFVEFTIRRCLYFCKLNPWLHKEFQEERVGEL